MNKVARPKTLAKVLGETSGYCKICGKSSGSRDMCAKCEAKVNREFEQADRIA